MMSERRICVRPLCESSRPLARRLLHLGWGVCVLLGVLTGQFVGSFGSRALPAQQEAYAQSALTALAVVRSVFLQVACNPATQVACNPVTLIIFTAFFMLALWCGGASGSKSGPPGWSRPTVRSAVLTAGELLLQVDPDGSRANQRQQKREKDQQMLADVFRQNLRLHD